MVEDSRPSRRCDSTSFPEQTSSSSSSIEVKPESSRWGLSTSPVCESGPSVKSRRWHLRINNEIRFTFHWKRVHVCYTRPVYARVEWLWRRFSYVTCRVQREGYAFNQALSGSKHQPVDVSHLSSTWWTLAWWLANSEAVLWIWLFNVVVTSECSWWERSCGRRFPSACKAPFCWTTCCKRDCNCGAEK